jgi:signal transduction histidine kinase
VAGVVNRACAQIELDATARRITIARALEPGLPTLEADAGQLHQVLLNLLLNATSATADGGRVEVSAARGQRDGAPAVVIAVRDSGAGIPPEALPHVFDPFFTTRENGTGLGLSISHAIVRDHGGTIDITSRPGTGTTVSVALPVEAGRRG